MPFNQKMIGAIDLSVAVLIDKTRVDQADAQAVFDRHFKVWLEQYIPTITDHLVDSSDGSAKAQLNDTIELSSSATGPVSVCVNYYLDFRDSSIDESWISALLQDCLKQLKVCFHAQFGVPRAEPQVFESSHHDFDLSQLGFGGLVTEPFSVRRQLC